MRVDTIYARYAAVITVAILMLASLTGCGGGSAGSPVLMQAEPAGDTPRAGFALAKPGSEQTPGLGLNITEQAGQAMVSVVAEIPLSTAAVMFELKYDSAGYTPQVVQATDAFALPADSLTIEMLDVPGLVSFGQVPVGTTGNSIEPGTVLAEVLFSTEPMATARAAADVPVHSGALCPLTFDGDTGELTLHYVNPGDYDQNGVVTASDLVPLGRNYGEAGPFEFMTALSVVDGNNNGQVEVADLTVIGQNWGHNVEAFNFYGSNEISDVPVGYAEPSRIAPLGSVAFADALGNPVEDRLRFSFAYDSAAPINIYWARPAVGETEGICSNLAGPTLLTQLGSQSNALPVAALSLDYTGLEAPAAVTLDASGSSDLDGVIAFYEWDFEGDGLYDAFGAEPVVSHVYNHGGIYAPLTRVTDNLGAWAIAQAEAFTVTEVLLPNMPPIADIVATVTSGTAPLSVGFLASGSSDPDGYIVKYEWDFDCNGMIDIDDGGVDLDSGTDPTVIHSFMLPGNYIVMVRVTDDRGDTATDTVLINVTSAPLPNQPPVAQLTADPPYGDAPLSVTLDASGSSDSDGSIVKYEWDFDGDGSIDLDSGTNPTVNHEYVEGGVYNVRLRVSDDMGDYAIGGIQITVGQEPEPNVPPVAAMDMDTARGVIPLRVTFDAFGSADEDGQIVSYSWDVDGDGEYDLFSMFPTAVYTYTEVGTYSAVLRVVDDGGLDDECSVTVTTLGEPSDELPVAVVSVNMQYSQVPLDVTFDATDSYSPFAEIVKYEWDFDGDGSFDAYGSTPMADHTYLVEGTFPAKVRVTDNYGFTGSTEIMIYALGLAGVWPGWEMFGQGPQHQRMSAVAGPQTSSIEWTHRTWYDIVSSPTVDSSSTIYVGGNDGYVYALNPDGSFKWRYETETATQASPVIGPEGRVYFATREFLVSSKIIIMNPDGTLHDEFAIPGSAFRAPAVDQDGNIYIGCEYDSFYKLSTTGTIIWSNEITSQSYSVPVIRDDGSILVCSKFKLHCYSPEGSELWSFFTGAQLNSSNTVIGNDGTVYQCSYNGHLYALDQAGNVLWDLDLPCTTNASPALGVDGTIYLGGNNGLFYAVNPNGSIAWSYLTGDRIQSTPAINSNGIVVVGSDDSTLYAFNPDGSLLWSQPVSSQAIYAPVFAANGMLYAACIDGNLYSFTSYGASWWALTGHTHYSSAAFSPDGTAYVGNWDHKLYAFEPNGDVKWTYETGDRICSSPAVGPDLTVYLGSQDGSMYALNPDGSLLWSLPTGGEVYSSPSVDADGNIYFGSYDSNLYAVNPDGSIRWSYPTGDRIYSSPAVGDDGTVVVGSDDNYIYAINPDGSLKWSFETQDDVQSSPAIAADGAVFVGSHDGNLYVIEPDGSLRWTFATEGAVSASPALYDGGHTIIGSQDCSVYAIAPDGSQVWKHTTAKPIYASPAIGSDGLIYGASGAYVFAMRGDGIYAWYKKTAGDIYASPAISADGTLLIGSCKGRLNSFGPE